MKTVKANSIVVKGDLNGGEIEPGTFHRECPVSPDIVLLGSDNRSDEDSVTPPDENNRASGCLFLEE